MLSAHHGSGSSLSPAFPHPLLNSPTIPNSTLISFHSRIPKPLTSTRPRRLPPLPTAAAPDPDLMSSQEAVHGSEKAEGSEVARSPPPPVKVHFGDDRNDAYKVSSTSQQKISIRNYVGENLVGILHETGSKKLMILCHGFRSSKESKTITCLINALTTENFSVFRFDFAGNGESEGTFQYGNYRREVDDLRAVVQYFTDQMWEVCAIAGHSKGGNVVLLYASMYLDIPKVVNISGRFDLRGGIEDRLGKDFMERVRKEGFIDVKDKSGKVMYRVTEESLMDRLSTDMRAACQTISENCTVLTIHGSGDEIVPTGDALEIAKYTSNHKLHIIEGADHRYMSHQLQLSKLLVEFVAFD